MSKKTETTTTKQYDPASMGAYQSLQGPAVGMTQDLMQHPYSSAFFQTSQGMGQRAINTQAGAMQQRLGQMGAALGTRGPVLGSMGDAGQRFGMSQGAQLNSNLILNAASMRQRALQDAMNYRPLQIGGKEVQSTSGLGTWLPSVVGLGLTAASGGLFGGAVKGFMGNPFGMMGKSAAGMGGGYQGGPTGDIGAGPWYGASPTPTSDSGWVNPSQSSLYKNPFLS